MSPLSPAKTLALSTVVAADAAAQMVAQWGYFIVFVIVLAQCAGVPLPAVAVLLAANAAARRGDLSLVAVIVLGSIGAIVGSTIGYVIGRMGGRPLMLRLARRFHADEQRINQLEMFFRRHGGKAIFLGRWVIVVRLWGAIAAGAAQMPLPTFMVWNVLGSFAWVSSLAILATVAGNIARAVGDWLDIGGWILAPVIVVSLIIWLWRRRKRTIQGPPPEHPQQADQAQAQSPH